MALVLILRIGVLNGRYRALARTAETFKRCGRNRQITEIACLG